MSFFHACPVVDHEFRHNIVKVAMKARGDSQVDPQSTLTMLWRHWLSITEQTHEKLMSICFYDIKLSIHVSVRILTILVNERAKISVVAGVARIVQNKPNHTYPIFGRPSLFRRGSERISKTNKLLRRREWHTCKTDHLNRHPTILNNLVGSLWGNRLQGSL